MDLYIPTMSTKQEEISWRNPGLTAQCKIYESFLLVGHL